jgi:hypothetical protein
MKKREREEAAHLYIEGQLTLDEITQKLKREKRPVARRSLGTWFAQDGWEKKRLAFLESQCGDVESLLKVIRNLEKQIDADQKKKIAPSPGRLHALANLRGEYARLSRQVKTEVVEEIKKTPLTVENFLKFEFELFGLKEKARVSHTRR